MKQMNDHKSPLSNNAGIARRGFSFRSAQPSERNSYHVHTAKSINLKATRLNATVRDRLALFLRSYHFPLFASCV